MGIQINGQTDTISATDGGLAVSGQQLTGVTDINASGIVTATQGYVVGTGASIFSPATNTLAFGTNGSERVRVDSSGNINVDSGGVYYDASSVRVGIGTSSPGSILHLQQSASAAVGPDLRLVNNAGTASDKSRISFYGGTSPTVRAAYDFNINASGVGEFIWSNGEGSLTERMRLDASGRLGIGTATPGRTLDVAGSIRSGGSTNPYIALNDNTTEAYFEISSSVTRISSGTSQPLAFRIGSSEAARIDANSRLLVGTSSSPGSGMGALSRLVVQGYIGDANDGAIISLQRGEAASSMTAGESIGRVSFNDNAGNAFAYVEAFADGSGGSGDYPGRLSFSVCRDGSASPTEAMRISNSGKIDITSDQGVSGVVITNTNASFASTGLYFSATRAANSVYDLLAGYSSGTSDAEFRARGDGNTFCDGAFTGGGADYAEYFEWSDSNSNAEDRRGISVVLDGDKIREAQAGEDPIGVISGNPSVVGDAAWNKWSGKYLRDEYGTYILDANGNRQLNPAYDPDVEYISREERPEWDCVGLMGKLRIRKGQVTGSRWIKMRDINDSVEEWLVR